MEQKNPNFHNEPGTWQTGRTEPPKRYSALISVLLVLVILLSGISTALSILNFKLYKQLTLPQETPPISFSRSADMPETADAHIEDLSLEGFGLRGTVIPSVYQRYYKLPGGIYVTKVTASSEAFIKGIVAGDIITRIGDTPVADITDLEKLTGSFTPGQEVTLHLYRNGTESCITLIWMN